MPQEYSSAATSLNQVPTLIKLIEGKEDLSDDQVLLDYGAGKYDKTREYLEGTHGVGYYAYDPYNRSEEENKEALKRKYDIIMLSNVLNVIKEKKERRKVLRHIRDLLKPGGRLYVRTYKATRTGAYREDPEPGQPTKKGTCWQNCQSTSFYEPEIDEVLEGKIFTNSHLVYVKEKVPEENVKSFVKFPRVTVKLSENDGNAFSILARCKKAARKGGVCSKKIAEFEAEAKSGDYSHLLQTCLLWFNIE